MSERLYRKVIRIRGEDSPNVRLAFAEGATLEHPERASGTMVCPGCLTWDDYVKRRRTWDKVRQCVGIDGMFWEGAEVLMFPPAWLDRAAEVASGLKRNNPNRKAAAIGCDPAEGGDRTAMAAVDELGLIELTSRLTPNTSDVRSGMVAFAAKHGLLNHPERWVIDAGNGGKIHADALRDQGLKGVRAVAFGEAVNLPLKRGLRRLEEKVDNREEKSAFFNRRAEMYGNLMELLDPTGRTAREILAGLSSPSSQENAGWGVPSTALTGDPVYDELRRQLAPIPKTTDQEGRLKLLPKRKPSPDSEVRTLTELIGCSPDEADAVALAVWGMLNKSKRAVAGAG